MEGGGGGGERGEGGRKILRERERTSYLNLIAIFCFKYTY